MNSDGLYTREELDSIGFRALGKDVSIDRTCRFFSPEHISIGSHVRIDAYTVISSGPGEITIGDYVHFGYQVSLAGRAGIVIESFAGLSAKVAIFSASDDYTGASLTNPTVTALFKHVTEATVIVRRHAIVGAGSVILPGVTLGIGSAVGALTVVRGDVAEFSIVSGNPMRRVGDRSRTILELEDRFLKACDEGRQV